MPGSVVRPVRAALIVASDTYDDPSLRRLRSPASDATALAEVLADPDIGDFHVQLLMNQKSYAIAEQVEAFFADRRRDDMLLLYFSCHGVKDDSGRLYFAASNTKLHRLAATGIPSQFVSEQMDRTRSRRTVVFLDCCYSGAFASLLAKGDERVDVTERLQGNGRVVITASSSIEYAFEGDQLAKDVPAPSVFTGSVVQSLRTGEADADGDGLISVEEVYDYVYHRVREQTPNQTPGMIAHVQGELFVAKARRGSLPAATAGPAAPAETAGAEQRLSALPTAARPVAESMPEPEATAQPAAGAPAQPAAEAAAQPAAQLRPEAAPQAEARPRPEAAPQAGAQLRPAAPPQPGAQLPPAAPPQADAQLQPAGSPQPEAALQPAGEEFRKLRDHRGEGQTAVAPPVTPRPPAEGPPIRGRRRWWWIPGVVLSLAAIVGAVVWWQSRDTPPPPPSALVWREVPSPFDGRVDAPGVTVHQGQGWVAGGSGSTGAEVVRLYNPGSRQWDAGPDLPRGLHHATLVSNGSSLFVLGGLTKESGKDVAVDSVYRLDRRDGAWVEDTPLPRPRFAGAAAWDGQRIVFAGGAESLRPRHAATDVWAMQDGTWTDVGDLHTPREHLAAATTGAGHVWFIGGSDVGGGKTPAVSEVDLVQGNSVTPATPLGVPLQGAAAVWTPEAGVCVIGGSTTHPNAKAKPVDTVECFGGPAYAKPWPRLPAALHGAGAARVGDTVYVVGGWAGPALELAIS